ncbi:carbohydrate-binding protein [Streptomyces antibioticus]|uniref:hypothetical protein n=1 Tax=Streptomyces antibioticus TaxID=1890 RepID=UPI00224E5981|nr:hypothetical protein [Streptomyces antibioticus]MCX4742470.1 hypothetical protein [Streptomyces antibioticus]
MQGTSFATEPSPTQSSAQTPMAPASDTVPTAKRDAVLGKSWKTSSDLAWTTSGDAEGFHVLTARKNDGYTWRTAASLSEPGFDADAWIGNICVTGSGAQAVVVYAPRTFTNTPRLMSRGGFTAVVDLASGHVTKLGLKASLSYYNPGCGIDETAVLTQSGGDGLPGTRLLRLDTRTAKLSEPIDVKGQYTSAVPLADDSIAAAAGAQVMNIDARGRRKALVRTDGVPYRLTPDREGGLAFLDKRGLTTKVKRIPAAAVTRPDARHTRATVLAQGLATETGLTSSSGTVYVTGSTELIMESIQLPSSVRQLRSTPRDVTVSTHGEAVLTHTTWADGKGTLLMPGDAAAMRTVKMSLTVKGTGRKASFTVDPARRVSKHAGQARAPSPGLAGGSTRKGKATLSPTVAGDPNEPVEAERTCSVPRNDPRNQAMQPKPRQVEWAVDQAVKGLLNTHIDRPANWKNLGMPAYMPQTLFLPPSLDGGGRAMAQVMLGVTTQESNMWQAGRQAVPGVTANPLIGNYYGINLYDGDISNDWDVNFAKADCGYGITQITDHMRMAGREDGHGGAAWDYQKQRAAALDYTANISAGLQTLISKWNETRAAGMIANHGTTGRPENWYFALWAYNSGFHPKTSDGAPWGLGWANNPANPEWDAGRLPFMENAAGGEDASAAARPQNWPYQEKVLGFAAHPPSFLESPGVMVPAFRPATWNGTSAVVTVKGSALYNRAHLKAPEDAFCDSSNSCNPGRISDSASNDSAISGPCSREDFQCWWNKPVTWKTDCVDTCGYEFIRFGESTPEEADGTAYPPTCSVTNLPDGALVIDDVPAGTPVVRPGCTNSWTNSGSFSFNFANNAVETVYPSKVDLHQLGAGFGGHFYFGHTRADDSKGQRLKITGTWTLNKSLNSTAKVWVHIPDHGAQTKHAQYEIDNGRWTSRRTVSQVGNTNRWVSLGAFRFSGVPKVRLTTSAPGGTGDEDIAFDAVAIHPGSYPVNGTELSLPAANPNAADIDYTRQDPEETPHARSAALAAQRQGTPPGKCTPVPTQKGVRMCLGFGKPASGKSPFASKSPFARVTDLDLVPWCKNRVHNSFDRFGGCIHDSSPLIATFVKTDGTFLGEVQWAMERQIKLYPDDDVIREVLKIIPVKMDPAIQSVSLKWFTDCYPACSSDPPLFSGATTWTQGDLHTTEALFTHEWTGSTADILKVDWLITGTSPQASNSSQAWLQEEDFDIRCDDGRAISGSRGCVFPLFVPTFTVNTKKYPTAAALYWVLKTKLKNHPGSKADNRPLHRLADSSAQDGNRRRMCQNVSARFDPHPDTPDTSCDEYPFAASKESGGQTSGVTGDQCAQFYAFKDSNGGWVLRDDDRVASPTWDELCGRGNIPSDHNEGAGGDLGRFTQDMRLMDDDAYWLYAPGFDDCGTSTFCQVHLP